MNKKLIKNTILFAGMAGVSTTAYMINVEAKNNPVSIHSYTVKSQIVDIPDANLKKGINNALGRGQVLNDITVEDMEKLNSLALSNKSIFDIEGLQYAVNLTSLDLHTNQIVDISPIQHLTKLTNLYIYKNKIEDISALISLNNIRYLAVGNNPITDLSPLSNLTSLNTLHINNVGLSDLSLLNNLVNLVDLQIGDNKISDISPLINLSNLTALKLDNNRITNVSPLKDLKKLTTLNLLNQNIVKNYTFSSDTLLSNIIIDNIVLGLENEHINATTISNSGCFENNTLRWFNVPLGENVFNSTFNKAVKVNSANAIFSGNITYNIQVNTPDEEGPKVESFFSINKNDSFINVNILAEDELSGVDYLTHKGERHNLPYTFNYDVFNRENNIVQVYDMVGNMTEYEVTADLLDLDTINSLMVLLEENENSPMTIAYIRAIINNMSESSNKDILNDKINNLSFDMTLDRLTTSANVDIYIKCENLLSMTLDTNMITFENYSSAEDMEKSEAIAITVNSSLPYQLNAYLPVEIQNADGTKTLDKSIFNIKESSEDEYKKFTSIGSKVVLKDNCEKGNGLIHLIDLKLSSDDAHDADVYKTTIKFEVEQK